MPPQILRRVNPKKFGRLVKTLYRKALIYITRKQFKQIGGLAIELKIPRRWLNQHFETLMKRGVKRRDLGPEMIKELTKLQELAQATNTEPKFLNLLLRGSRKSRPMTIEQAMQRMQELIEAQQAEQQRAAA